MQRPLLIIGLDGLEPSLVQKWTESGDLPTLSRLRQEGRWGALRSTLPFATFPAWTSFMTGVNPGEHGVFDFAHLLPGTYDVSFAGATIRRRPTFARLAGEMGLRVASVGFPGTYPPEPLPGISIGGFDSPVAVGIDDSFVHPPELARELRERFGRYVFADFAETHTWMPGWHRRAAESLIKGAEKRADIATWLLQKEPWDLFMVHFGESDTVAHHFWAFHDASSPRRPRRNDAFLQSAIRRVYVELDRAVSRLIAAAPEGARVMLASDHGFGGSSDKVLYLNRWLAEQGMLRFHQKPGAPQKAFSLATKAGLALLPGRAQEKLWRLMGDRAGLAEARRRFSMIDWSGTSAYSEELSYHPSIRLNVKGREPAGTLSPEDVPFVLEDLIGRLKELRDPWNGRPVIQKAWKREDLYQGPAVEDAPELVLNLAIDEGYSYNCLSSQGDGPVWRRLLPEERIGAKGAGMNGTHRHDGFWLLHGDGVVPRRKRADMVDMAPTAMAALGLEIPSWMEGQPHFLPTSSSRSLPQGADSLYTATGDLVYTRAQEAILKERLHRLGYI